MLVDGSTVAPAGASWRRGLRASLFVAGLAAVSLAPFLGGSAEVVTMRVHLFIAAVLGGAATVAALVCTWALVRTRSVATRSNNFHQNSLNASLTRNPWMLDQIQHDNQYDIPSVSDATGVTPGVAIGKETSPQIVVFTNLFPHSGTPGAGSFIRERMFRIARTLPMVVVVPVPWFPLQGLMRRFRPHFRPPAPQFEVIDGVPVFIQRFFSFPGFFRCLDGLSIAVACWPLMRRLKRTNPHAIIDAHFAYPAGYAGVLLSKWLTLPVTITMRGTEVSLATDLCRRARMATALRQATRVIAVSDSLRQHAGVLGADASQVKVIGNGVDLARFFPEDRQLARGRYAIPLDAPVLVSVGGLVERKGFHRVIALLPELLVKYPGLRYLVVGGSSPEGDISAKLRQQVVDLKLNHVVQFLGPLPPADVRWPLSAANVFVLATSNEGWANVFLEAMACGLPVVTTNVGGNAEVVCRPAIGTVVELGDEQQLFDALGEALHRSWDRSVIVEYARSNTWDSRIAVLLDEFRDIADRRFNLAPGGARSDRVNG